MQVGRLLPRVRQLSWLCPAHDLRGVPLVCAASSFTPSDPADQSYTQWLLQRIVVQRGRHIPVISLAHELRNEM